MRDHVIVGVHITDRTSSVGEVQTILTRHGSNIRTRLGLHDTVGDAAAAGGLILLETIGASEHIDAMCAALRQVPGVQVQQMYFSHPE